MPYFSLTNFIKANPASLLLFIEFKSYPDKLPGFK